MATVAKKSGAACWQAMIRAWQADSGTWKRVWRTTGVPVTEDKAKAVKVAETLQKAALSACPANPRRMDRRAFVQIVEELWRAAGVDPPPMSSTWREFWPEHIRSLNISEKSRGHYSGHCEGFQGYLEGKADAMLWDLSYRDCQGYYDQLLREGRSPGTARNYLKSIRAVLSRAHVLGAVPSNVAELVVLPDIQTTERLPFTKDEIKAIFQILRNPPATFVHLQRTSQEWLTAALLGLYCGMRIGDATQRVWGDFDMLAETVTFIPEKKQRKGKPVTLPLTGPLLDHLQAIEPKTGQLTPILAGMTKTSEYFGKILERLGIVEKRADDSGRNKLVSRSMRQKSFHSLRHTVLTELARSGADKQLRQLLADHDDARVNDKYTHAQVERLATALGNAFPV